MIGWKCGLCFTCVSRRSLREHVYVFDGVYPECHCAIVRIFFVLEMVNGRAAATNAGQHFVFGETSRWKCVTAVGMLQRNAYLLIHVGLRILETCETIGHTRTHGRGLRVGRVYIPCVGCVVRTYIVHQLNVVVGLDDSVVLNVEKLFEGAIL